MKYILLMLLLTGCGTDYIFNPKLDEPACNAPDRMCPGHTKPKPSASASVAPSSSVKPK